MINNYWCCSKFADWIRGTKKPMGLPGGEWDIWHEGARRAHPVRYWLAETALQFAQDVLYWPIQKWRDVYYYCKNRFVHRVHFLPTNLPKGQWYDFDTRLIHGMFGALVDYVELELGFEGPYRSRSRGEEHLAWEMDLVVDEGMGADKENVDYGKPTHQAVTAKEISKLYTWWKDLRDERVDPFDFIDESTEIYKDRYGKVDELETKYRQEDEEMMISLIRIRQSIWS